MLSSLQNNKIKSAIRLRDRKERDQTGLFLIEGVRELKRAIQSGFEIETAFVCPNLCREKFDRSIECSEEVFAKLAMREGTEGVIAVAKQRHLRLQDLKKTSFLLIAETIEKPGNLGNILRSSDGAGVDGVIVCDPKADIYNPNVVRASIGTIFSVPVVQATTRETLLFLKEKGVCIVAATPHAKIDYTQADLKQNVAIAVGSEQLGLSEEWMKQAKIQVRIPMLGIADSLNVASATTLVLYEVLRQRRV